VGDVVAIKGLVRRDDPETSYEAALKATRAAPQAAAAVRYLMTDGVERIDEEIWKGCREMGYISSFDTVRHGRLALSKSGFLRSAGKKRLTSNNSNSLVWAMNNSVFDQPALSNRPGVQKTKELSRIVSLPRRKLNIEKSTLDGAPLPDLTPLYLKLGGPCSEHPRCPICADGPVRLWPAQSAALLEAERGWGLFGPMGVGSGKSLVTLLLPDVLNAKQAVLLVPAALRNQLLTRDMEAYGRHFHLPVDRIKVVAYTELSSAKTAEVLEEHKPDLIIADEAHSLAHAQAARTKRFVRYMREHPDTRFCALSGTITRRSLRDYSHLCEIALRAGSPVPGNWSDLNDWADALDPIPNPLSPGALKVFAEGDVRLAGGDPDAVRVAVREGYRRRLVETPGVVATSESWEGASLIVAALPLSIPVSVEDAIDKLKKTWEIDGEELEDIVRVVEVARQLALGFYYHWCWPDGVKDLEWLSARAAWHRQVRTILQHSRAGLDSPLLVARAAQRGQLDQDATEAWAAWQPLSKRYNPTPPVEAVWLDRYAIEGAVKWAAAAETGILWYSHQAVGEALGKAGLSVYGAGTDAGEADPAKQPVIACSISAQGTGKNLQRYSKALVMEPPPSGATWEQLIGRQHRPGQQADEVTFDVFAHTGELMGALYRAVEDSRYVQQTQGQRQKMLCARRVGW
jgi:hypothetical protein